MVEHMSAHVVIPLSEVSRYSTNVVGTRALNLAKYDALALPLPETVIIPTSSWQKLAEENDLAKFFTNKSLHDQWNDATKRHYVKQELRKLISQQTLPEWFTQPILHEYHNLFARGFVRLLPGDQISTLDTTRFEHIQGDSNLFESLKEFWASWIEDVLELTHNFNHTALIPGAVLIQAQSQPSVSGVAYTKHPDTGNKAQIAILAHKGAPDQELLANQSDQFLVDIRTWNVVFRKVVSQTRMLQRATDHIESVPVPFQEQLHPSLSDTECLQLAQLISQFKQHSMQHFQIYWELDDEGFKFTDFTADPETKTRKPASLKTLTKLYVSAGNPYKALQRTDQIDGIGVLRSEYTYAQFGIHPAHIVHSRQKEVLERALQDCIEQYQHAVNQQRVIFRSQNFNSQESSDLQYGQNYEPQEDNPYLGYRGGLKLLSQPDLLRIELGVLQNVLHKTNGKLGYMLSFVRTPQELAGLIHHVEAAGLLEQPNFELWLQLNTPENILNLLAYPLQHVAGVSLNIKTLQALLHGIDPDNPEVYERYSLDLSLLEQMMELLAEERKQFNALRDPGKPLQLNLHLEDFARELVETAVKLSYDGIVVKPRSAQIARGIIVEAEEKKIAEL